MSTKENTTFFSHSFGNCFVFVYSFIWLKNARFLTFALKLTSCFNYAILITVQLVDIHAISPCTEDLRNNRLAHMFHISSISELRIFHLNDRVGFNLIIWVWKCFVWGPTLQRVCSLFYIRYAAQITWRKVKSTDFRPF